MSFCFLHKLYRVPQGTPQYQNQPLIPSSLSSELEDSRRFALNAIMALLAVFTASGSRALQPVIPTLLMYIISLHLATNSCFLHDYPTLCRFIHAIPFLAIFCMAGVSLGVDLRSPALTTAGIILGVLPLFTLVIHRGGPCGETSLSVDGTVDVQPSP